MPLFVFPRRQKVRTPTMPPTLRKPKKSPVGEQTMQALVHELRVHQIELEQQNEELRRAHDDLAAARDRFVDLFDFAPVGYLTLDGAGLIVEANLTAAAQLSVMRQSMLGRQFMGFVAAADGDRWQRLKALALRRGDPRRIELALRRHNGQAFYAQLDCVRVAPFSALLEQTPGRSQVASTPSGGLTRSGRNGGTIEQTPGRSQVASTPSGGLTRSGRNGGAIEQTPGRSQVASTPSGGLTRSGRNGGAQLRVALTDISERKLAETNRRIANSGNDAHESERRRVAYELHEDLAQRLSAIKLRLGSLGSPAQPMTEALDQALVMVLRMSSELHPLMLHNLGLVPALEWMARDATLRLGVAVTLQADEDEPPLAETTAVAVYRLVEMSLAQLARHAHRGISIVLLRRPRDVVLELRADSAQAREAAPAGVTADPMQTIRDCVHLLGGRLEIVDQLPDFRSITICLPLVGAG
jgi:signal transduction histidine kinase